jgi:hydrogenase maturation protease
VTPRVLVAGIGNIFFGDDGFGVEVARRLVQDTQPAGVTVVDVGIRALHLAYTLLDRPDLLLVIDAVSRGQPAGTLFLIEPADDDPDAALAGAHGMTLGSVLATVRGLGGEPPRVLLVGCEPEFLGERLGLSDVVEAAIPGAMELVRDTIMREVFHEGRSADSQA